MQRSIFEFTNIFIASICVKIFTLFFFKFFLSSIKKISPDFKTKYFDIIFYILLIRDFLFFLSEIFFPPLGSLLREILLVSDILVFFLYVQWLNDYTKNRTSIKIIIPNAVYLLILLLNRVFFFMPGTHSFIPLAYHQALIRLIAIVNMVYLSVKLYEVSEFNTENADFILSSRKSFTTLYVFFNIILFFIPVKHIFTSSLLIPFSYTVHFYLLSQYLLKIHIETENKISSIEEDLSSLFKFMKTIGDAISEKLEMSQVLEYIVGSAVQNINADAGAILLVDEYDDILRVKAVSGIFPPPYSVPEKVKVRISALQDYFTSTPIPIGETVIGEVVKTGKPIFIRNTINDDRMIQNTKNDTISISSIIIIPLLVSNRILGVLTVIKKKREDLFGQNDYDNIITFANYTSITLDNLLTYLELQDKKELEREVGVAADIQQKLLPRKIPKIPNVSISAFSNPAKGVSGDYYDIIKIKKDKISLVMCDVAGKGVPASLVMVMIRSIIHLISGADKSVSTIVRWINRGVTGQIDIDHYATLCYLSFNPETYEINFSNAGHHPLLIYRSKSGTFESVDTEGLPIGIERNSEFGEKSVILEKNDIVLLYTDGIIEAMNLAGEQYSYDSLLDIVAKNSKKTPGKLTKAIQDDMEKFVGKAQQHDDQTLLVMKIG